MQISREFQGGNLSIPMNMQGTESELWFSAQTNSTNSGQREFKNTT